MSCMTSSKVPSILINAHKYVIPLSFHTGMLEYETKEILLQHTVNDNFYSLSDLNQHISSIELGYMESRDRPSLVSSLSS